MMRVTQAMSMMNRKRERPADAIVAVGVAGHRNHRRRHDRDGAAIDAALGRRNSRIHNRFNDDGVCGCFDEQDFGRVSDLGPVPDVDLPSLRLPLWRSVAQRPVANNSSSKRSSNLRHRRRPAVVQNKVIDRLNRKWYRVLDVVRRCCFCFMLTVGVVIVIVDRRRFSSRADDSGLQSTIVRLLAYLRRGSSSSLRWRSASPLSFSSLKSSSTLLSFLPDIIYFISRRVRP